MLLIDEVITFAEATKIWGLGDSTLRSVARTNRLQENVDFRKSGCIWLITRTAMIKLYGQEY